VAGSAAEQLVSDLKVGGIDISPGLQPSERSTIEAALGLKLPPDFAELLEAGVPTGDRFPDWHGGAAAIAGLVAAPVEGIVFDVEQNGLWLEEWGPRPLADSDAIRVATNALAHVPPLVPVWGHRYLPTDPHSAGNPVLSVVQTDIIVYGTDLADYFAHEFHLVGRDGQHSPGKASDLPFWGQFVD
jgi:hypothetical protein